MKTILITGATSGIGEARSNRIDPYAILAFNLYS